MTPAHPSTMSGVPACIASSGSPTPSTAGAEKGYNHALVGNAGANLIYEAAGMHASLLGFSMEGVVLDNDVIGSCLRTIKGIDLSDEAMSIDVIRNAVIGGPGHYLGSKQTLEIMQTEYIYPKMHDRLSHKEWAELGRPKVLDRAIDTVKDVLATHYPSHISEAVDAQIRSELPIRLDRSKMLHPHASAS